MDQELHTRVIRLEARMTRMETMMKALLERVGIDPTQFEPPEPPQLNAIRATLLAGDKIKAIKLYREFYGVDLKEAKDALDAMEGQIRGGY